jgi:uncharacterized protein YdeI (YjbR/CyaY-like superfamily)
VKPENVRFFDSASEFRAWLADNHASAPSQWVGFYKKAAGLRGLTYDEAVIEALCFGWIDGQTNRVDDLAITTRFSPRRRTSNWSESNLRRMADLIAAGRVHPAGLLAFETRLALVAPEYSYESRPLELPEELASIFRANDAAWAFWNRQPPGYRRQMTWWVVSAKREETRLRRLAALIDEHAAGRRIDPLNLPKVSVGSR